MQFCVCDEAFGFMDSIGSFDRVVAEHCYAEPAI